MHEEGRHALVLHGVEDVPDPVECVGGVQVYADILGHITAAYMRTVAPFLLRRPGG